MPVCQVCQKDNPQGVEYCEDCGAALTPSKEPAPVGAAVSTGADGTAATPRAAAPASASTEPGSLDSVSAQPSPQPDAGPTPSAPGGVQQARLIVRRFGAPTGDEIPLLAERLTVGRFDPETGPVDIDLSTAPESGHISRQHGELYRESDGRWFVRDLGSTNGVFVKGGDDASFGPRITEPRELKNGDELAFGNSRFVFKTD